MLLLTHTKKVVRRLTVDEIRLCSTALTPDTDLYIQQQKLLNLWRDQNYWLQCDCKESDKEQAILSLRRLQSGLVIFANLPSSARHVESCTFHRIIKYKQFEKGQRIRQDKKKTDYVFHRQAVERAERDEDNESEGVSRSVSTPGLVRFLNNLIHDASMHQCSYKTKAKEEAFLYRLKLAAQDFTLNKIFRLSDYLYTDMHSVASAIGRLQATARFWTGSAKPHCVFLFVIDEIQANGKGKKLVRYREDLAEVNVEEFNLDENVELVQPGRVVIGERNPGLAVVTFTDLSITDVPMFGAAKALVVPIVSHDFLMVVESNYERVVANSIRVYQRFLAIRAKARFFIRMVKPLDDIQSPMSHQKCRPDFILETGNRKVILEVMGSHDEEYLERKSRTIPIMEEIAPVVEFDAHAAAQNNELERLSMLAVRETITRLMGDDPYFSQDIFQELDR